MKILLVGPANSIWIKSFVENILLPYKDDVTVLSFDKDFSNYIDYYNLNNVRVIPIKNLSSRICLILSAIKYFNNGYDVINFQYISNICVYLIPIARFFCKKVIVSAWGSDILRKECRDLYAVYIFKLSKKITLNTEKMLTKFRVIYGDKYLNKINIVRFGSPSIEYFRNNIFSDEISREKYNINKNKIVISIGYNSSPAQQHKEVLNCINSLSKEEKDRIHIILRMTYGAGDTEYINTIFNLARNIGCSVSLFKDYLSEKDIFELTNITDVFIHSQTTDALSASFCEHIYSKCLVFNASWLEYKELEDCIFFIKFNSFDDLKNKLKDNLLKKQESAFYKNLDNNSQLIYDRISWNSFKSEWRRVYNEW